MELEVYEILKNRFSDKEAAKVMEYFELKAEEKYLQKKDVLATKQDNFRSQIRYDKIDVYFLDRTTWSYCRNCICFVECIFKKIVR